MEAIPFGEGTSMMTIGKEPSFNRGRYHWWMMRISFFTKFCWSFSYIGSTVMSESNCDVYIQRYSLASSTPNNCSARSNQRKSYVRRR